MSEITYIKGDATNPLGAGVKIICHVCNDMGRWGKGFVLAVSRRWSEPEEAYRKWFREGATAGFALGAVQFVQVEPFVWIANMIGQHGIKRGRSGPPIRYPAIESCLRAVAIKATELSATVHMPRIGCGLAGGEWMKIEPLILAELTSHRIAVAVYDLA